MLDVGGSGFIDACVSITTVLFCLVSVDGKGILRRPLLEDHCQQLAKEALTGSSRKLRYAKIKIGVSLWTVKSRFIVVLACLTVGNAGQEA